MKRSELPKASQSWRPYEIENAVVEGVRLTTANHGILSGYLDIAFDGSSRCSFGGYCLGRADGNSVTGKTLDYAADFIARCLKVAGVEDWSDIAGRNVRVLHSGLGGHIVAIGHIVKDEWFCPQIEWENKETK